MKQPKSPPTKPIIGYTEDRVLSAFVHYDFLTARQVTRLLYSERSFTHAQGALARLAAAGHLKTRYAPVDRVFVKPPTLYYLGQPGINYLATLGLIAPRRLRQLSEGDHAKFFMQHRLAAYDVCIAAEAWARTEPRVEISRVITERELATFKDPATPDAWFALVVDGSLTAIALELDLGTEDKQKWQTKIERLVTWIDDAYRDRYQTTNLTIAVVAPALPARASILLEWTEEKLATMDLKDYGELFLFGCLNAPEVELAAFFTTPHFLTPFTREQVPLVTLR